MDHSYFKEPTGIFKTLKGFSMGDKSAARGSEIIVRIAEIEIFNSLSCHKILKNVTRYLRFHDDVSLHLSGAPDDILKCVQTICKGYLEALQFNMETWVLHGKFLNIRIYIKPGLNHLQPSLGNLIINTISFHQTPMLPIIIKKWQASATSEQSNS